MYKVIQFYGVIILRTTVMHLFIKVLCLFVKIRYQNKLIEKISQNFFGKKWDARIAENHDFLYHPETFLKHDYC